MSRIIVSREMHEPTFDPKAASCDRYRKNVANKVLGEVDKLVRVEDWFLKTKNYINTRTVSRSFRFKHYRRNGRVAVSLMSDFRCIYILPSFYGFGVDPEGRLYESSIHRDLNFKNDVVLWRPLGGVASSHFCTEILEGHLLPALQDMTSRT